MTWLDSKKEKAVLDNHSDDTISTTSVAKPSSFTRNDILLCSTAGNIYAVHKHTGARLWRADFPTGSTSRFASGSGGGIVSLFITDEDRVIIAATGKAAALDLLTGEVLWVNKMKGFGYEEVGAIVTPSHALKPQRSTTELPNEDDDAPPGYDAQDQNKLTQKPVVVLCSGGKCMGVNIETGEELWRFNCPKGGFRLPVALVDPEGGSATVYVGVGTRLYCLDANTGDLKWETKVTNSIMYSGYMTLATPWSSRLSAEAHTAFSQFPVAQLEQMRREKSRS
ncbi:hypothetical protein INT45_009591 [Circinella minor]|uniref:Pyrrolo-quinoline quinone repeat domain-containing protein n=1 Tax=Circinella minor TaxID=1195481 RepID=A0A8H7S736_9FUNG|nr:hypothetical protein INT45_009591 [Circinella minor]